MRRKIAEVQFFERFVVRILEPLKRDLNCYPIRFFEEISACLCQKKTRKLQLCLFLVLFVHI